MPKQTLWINLISLVSWLLCQDRANLCWCFQGVDMFSLDIIELNEGVPHDGRTGRLYRKPVSLHAGYSQKVSLGAPLGLNICGGKKYR